MKKIAIIGAGMMGSALAFPARENGNEVLLIGTCIDNDIITNCKRTNRHPKFERDFPSGVQYHMQYHFNIEKAIHSPFLMNTLFRLNSGTHFIRT